MHSETFWGVHSLLPITKRAQVQKQSRIFVLMVNNTMRGIIPCISEMLQDMLQKLQKGSLCCFSLHRLYELLVSAVKNISPITFYDRFNAWAPNHSGTPGVLRIWSWIGISSQGRVKLLRCWELYESICFPVWVHRRRRVERLGSLGHM